MKSSHRILNHLKYGENISYVDTTDFNYKHPQQGVIMTVR